MISQKKEIIKITFIDINDRIYDVYIECGKNLLIEARKQNVPIYGRCDAQLSCTTCHVYIERDFFLKNKDIQNLDDDELDILEKTDSCEYNSRLCCQIKVKKEMNNMIVRIEESSFKES